MLTKSIVNPKFPIKGRQYKALALKGRDTVIFEIAYKIVEHVY